MKNERIRELIVKAGIEIKARRPYFDEYPDGYLESDNDFILNNHDTIIRLLEEGGLEKFAELIVRECMKEAWDEIIPDEDIAQEKDPLIREYLKGSNQGIVDAVIRFRNHFGVEE